MAPLRLAQRKIIVILLLPQTSIEVIVELNQN
jgi:hypothetical protein